MNYSEFKSEVKKFIDKHKLFKKADKLLIAFSGGPDSVLLIKILHDLEFQNIEAAHFNYEQRGSDSEGDQEFCQGFCHQHKIALHTKRLSESHKNIKSNFQEEARHLRYDWMRSIVTKNSFQYIVTGHHLDDHREGFFLNLMRGSGLNGLKGMKPKNKDIVRPFLFIPKDQILKTLVELNIEYRNDASNQESKYKRNLVRNEVLNRIDFLFPEFQNNYNFTREALLSAHEALDSQASLQSETEYDLAELLQDGSGEFKLWRLMNSLNFSRTQFNQVLSLHGKTELKSFYSKTHCLNFQRGKIITNEKKDEPNKFFSEVTLDNIPWPTPFGKIIVTSHNHNSSVRCMHNECMLPKSLLDKGAILRKIQDGDHFKPFGIHGNKKIADYVTDKKITWKEKENLIVLCNSENKILWLVGHRASEKTRINNENKEVLKLVFLPFDTPS